MASFDTTVRQMSDFSVIQMSQRKKKNSPEILANAVYISH